jgi:aryl-alcohol dehydrogenase-like predicted oxidoreductase
METVLLDGTDLRLSRVAFGTGSLHRVFSAAHRRRLLAAAVEQGVTHFDTAPFYGYGLAEADLGAFLRGRRDRLTVATKVGLYPPLGAIPWLPGVWMAKAAGKVVRSWSRPRVDWRVSMAERSLDESLRRLRTDYVDLLLLHEPDLEATDTEAFLAWLGRERERGRVRYWGLAGEPERIVPWLESDQHLALVLQTRDSLHDREGDQILRYRQSLQLTYGYIRAARRQGDSRPAAEILGAALRRNATGVVVTSASSELHLHELLGRLPGSTG